MKTVFQLEHACRRGATTLSRFEPQIRYTSAVVEHMPPYT